MTGDEEPDQQGVELLKTSEVARMLGVARSTVLSWAYRGLLDFTRTPGGQLRFSQHQVEAIRAAGVASLARHGEEADDSRPL